MAGRSRVVVLFAGGTIGMLRDASNALVPALRGADICAAVPLLSQFDLTIADVCNLPSTHLGLEDLFEMHARAESALASGADGVVLVQGTDTLEETAFFLDLLHRHERTIVCTGSMRTRDDDGWDGPANFLDSCKVACSPEFKNCGVVIGMNRTVHAACEVVKTHTEALAAFESPGAGALGTVIGGVVKRNRGLPRRARVQGWPAGGGPPPRVDIVYSSVGCDGALVQASAKAGARGIVAVGMGRGNIPPQMAEAVVQVASEGITVVLTTRCWHGKVAPVYGYAGSGRHLESGGVLLAPGFTAGKARIALCVALHAACDRRELTELFNSMA